MLLWVLVRRAVRLQIGCRREAIYRLRCLKLVARIAPHGYTFRLVTLKPWETQRLTGATKPRLILVLMGVQSTGHAARCWAEAVQSMVCCMCVASPKILITGASLAMTGGAGTMFCP